MFIIAPGQEAYEGYSVKKVMIPNIVHIFKETNVYWSSFRLIYVWKDTKEQNA